MGYLNNDHIREFVRGQTVLELTTDSNGIAWLEFATGEKLRLYATVERGRTVIIATPFSADGSVKQSTQIMANAAGMKINRRKLAANSRSWAT